jgi:two-component system, cell cycle response regulator
VWEIDLSQKVLLIDDCPSIHGLVRTRLREQPIELHSAFDGESGLQSAVTLAPDLILLDVEMPAPDGFEVCHRLKDDSRTMSIPVIFLTGATSTEEKIKGLELGAVDYITKPFDPAELRARVRASLRTKYLMDLLARKAMIDGLSGLWNRAYLDARLEAEMSLALRTGRPIACIMLDVDKFKMVNDRFGHPFGDEVLRMVATTLGNGCRAEDIVCRYGGEEFAVLLPNTPAQAAVELAERLRIAIESEPFQFKNTPVKVTASFGVAGLRTDDPRSIIEAADAALYVAKHSGRNRVCITATPSIDPQMLVA